MPIRKREPSPGALTATNVTPVKIAGIRQRMPLKPARRAVPKTGETKQPRGIADTLDMLEFLELFPYREEMSSSDFLLNLVLPIVNRRYAYRGHEMMVYPSSAPVDGLARQGIVCVDAVLVTLCVDDVPKPMWPKLVLRGNKDRWKTSLALFAANRQP